MRTKLFAVNVNFADVLFKLDDIVEVFHLENRYPAFFAALHHVIMRYAVYKSPRFDRQIFFLPSLLLFRGWAVIIVEKGHFIVFWGAIFVANFYFNFERKFIMKKNLQNILKLRIQIRQIWRRRNFEWSKLERHHVTIKFDSRFAVYVSKRLTLAEKATNKLLISIWIKFEPSETKIVKCSETNIWVNKPKIEFAESLRNEFRIRRKNLHQNRQRQKYQKT